MIWLVASAWAEIRFESPPTDGIETVIAVAGDEGPAPGETVRVVTRPGLAGSREIAVGITDGRGRVRWTPQGGGVTTVRAGNETRDLLVATAGVPRTTAGLLGVLALVGVAALLAGMWPRRGRA